MRLRKSKNTAEEELIVLLNRGYQVLNSLRADYNSKRQEGSFNPAIDHQRYEHAVNEWGGEVINTLNSIFPTELEANQFLHPPHVCGGIRAETPDDYKAGSLRARLDDLLKGFGWYLQEFIVNVYRSSGHNQTLCRRYG
jgi:hypothetical protein